jgi:excisionase family DNA binding protein
VILTVADAARALSCSERTVEREIRDGRLPAIRVRGLVRIDPDDLRAYIDRSRRVEEPCRSESDPADIRSALQRVAASALSELCRPAPLAQTRVRSKLGYCASESTPRRGKLHRAT